MDKTLVLPNDDLLTEINSLRKGEVLKKYSEFNCY